MRLLLILVLGSTLAASAPAVAQGHLPPAIDAALARGDSSRAYEAVRGALARDAFNPALHRARLRLELEGVGTGNLPRVMRQQQYVDTARALLRLVPNDTLALRILVADAVWTVLSVHDRVTPLSTRSAISGAGFVSRQEIAARMGRSRFDIDARRALAGDLDASGPARKARRDAGDWIATWRTAAPSDPRAYAAAVSIAAVDGAWAEALDAAQALRAARPDLAVGDLFAGLAHYRLGDAETATAAFGRALEALGPHERAHYENLTPLLTPDQRAAYEADPQRFAADFWAASDPRRLSALSERRAEHLARVVEADLLFGRTLATRFDPTPPPARGAETEQGRIWVRYGRPDRTTRFSPNDNGVDAYGDSRFAVWDYADFRFVFDDPDRDGGYRTYSPPASAMSRSPRAADDDFVLQDREMQRDAPQQTQYAPGDLLDVPVLASRFRAPGGGTRVVVGYGVPTGSVTSGVFVLDAAERVTEQERRIVVVRDSAGQTEAAALSLAGSSVRVEVETDGGRRWGASEVPLSPLPGSGFGLSDLLLALSADESEAGPIRVGDVLVAPASRGVFGVTEPIAVVVEVYGLTLRDGRSDYAVEASLTPVDRRRGLRRLFGRRRTAGVAVAFDAQGDRSTEATSTLIDASGQEAGRYMLTFTVTDRATGQTASVTREIVLEN